jgi:RNA polymerase sigma-70 factor, ECF subfamily
VSDVRQYSDEPWLADLLREHWAPVVRMLARYVGDQHTAEDLAQQVFLVAWRKRGAFVGGTGEPREPRPWLFGIARNLARNHLRREWRRQVPWRKLCADPLWTDGGIGHSELAHDVAEACKRLTDKELECLVLAIQDDLTDEEIADILRISPQNVRQQRHRARAKLRAALSDLTGTRADSRSATARGE